MLEKCDFRGIIKFLDKMFFKVNVFIVYIIFKCMVICLRILGLIKKKNYRE